MFLQQAEEQGFEPRLFEHKVSVIYPAIPASSLSVVDEAGKLRDHVELLFVGNDFFRKGGRAVLAAFSLLKKTYNLKLKIVSNIGHGDYITKADDNERNKAIGQIEADADITWLQQVNNLQLMESIFPNADVFVMPTMGDTFGFVNIEAMACGLPVISTRLFAIPEQVVHGECGYLIDVPLDRWGRLEYQALPDSLERRRNVAEVENHMAEQLADYVERLIENPTHRAAMGKNARKRALAHFDVAIRDQALMRVYDSLS